MKAEDKLARVGACLQKTPPPVLVFAEKTRDVDMVHEFLLTKGVDAVAIHGAPPSVPLSSTPPPPPVRRMTFRRLPCCRAAPVCRGRRPVCPHCLCSESLPLK